MGPPLCQQFKHFPYKWRNPVMRFTVQVTTTKIRTQSLRGSSIIAVLLCLGASWMPPAAGQAVYGSHAGRDKAEAVPHPERVATGLGILVGMAGRDNPPVLAPAHAWEGHTHPPPHASPPPTHHITV